MKNKTIVFGLMVIVLIGVIWYFAFNKSNTLFNKQTPISTANCKNSKLGYELTYPTNWKVWTKGAGEARPATCDENLISYYFAKDIFGTPFVNQINLIVYTRENQVEKFWSGVNSLDTYIGKLPAVVKSETKLGGERAVRIKFDHGEDGLIAYHNDAIYAFTIYSTDESTVNTFLASFKFTE